MTLSPTLMTARPITLARIRRDAGLRRIAETLIRAECALHRAARGELSQGDAQAAHADVQQALALLPTALLVPPTRLPKG
jgi:hypothetical protein